MRQLLLLFLVASLANPLHAQYVYTINADSVKITNHCDTAELIIENHTQTVPGFLFNKGRGRTEFRRGLFTIDDTLYMIGADTLNLSKALTALTANNGLLKTGNTIQFGNDASNPYGPASQIRPTYYNQNNSTFNWTTGNALFTVSKTPYTDVPVGASNQYNLAKFVSPQGGIIMEGNVRVSNGPLHWINFKNTDPGSMKRAWVGDSIVAQILTGAFVASDNKIYSSFTFSIPDDTSTTTGYSVLKLFPSVTSGFSVFKVPSAVITRVNIEDNIGCNPCMSSLNNNNPYSRLVVDAKNYPLVVGNLPASTTAGRVLVIDNDGKIWKGDSTSSLAYNGVFNSSLAVNGTITAQKLRLSQNDWPDYVFAPQYHLPQLSELEQYIKQHNHLPGIPSATEVQKNGIDVGGNQAALLKKIEELTLYLVEQEKKWQAQNTALEKQNKEMEDLKQQMAELRKLIGK